MFGCNFGLFGWISQLMFQRQTCLLFKSLQRILQAALFFAGWNAPRLKTVFLPLSWFCSFLVLVFLMCPSAEIARILSISTPLFVEMFVTFANFASWLFTCKEWSVFTAVDVIIPGGLGAAMLHSLSHSVQRLKSASLPRDKQFQGWLPVGRRPIRSQAEERRVVVSEEDFGLQPGEVWLRWKH